MNRYESIDVCFHPAQLCENVEPLNDMDGKYIGGIKLKIIGENEEKKWDYGSGKKLKKMCEFKTVGHLNRVSFMSQL